MSRRAILLTLALALAPRLARATGVQLCGRVQESWQPIRLYDSVAKCEAAREATINQIAARSCVVAPTPDKCRADLRNGLACIPVLASPATLRNMGSQSHLQTNCNEPDRTPVRDARALT
jgi:hypothetical protein